MPLEVVLVRHGNVTYHPKLPPAVSVIAYEPPQEPRYAPLICQLTMFSSRGFPGKQYQPQNLWGPLQNENGGPLLKITKNF